MTEKRPERHRETYVHRQDARVAGFYEQSLDDVDRLDLARSLATVIGSLAGLDVRGLVNRPGRVSFATLRSIAGSDRLSDYDVRTIQLSELLCHVQVDADAELIVWDTPEQGRLALSVDATLLTDSAHLMLGGDSSADGGDATGAVQSASLSRPWHEPIVLHSSQLPGARPVQVTRMHAMTVESFERELR